MNNRLEVFLYACLGLAEGLTLFDMPRSQPLAKTKSLNSQPYTMKSLANNEVIQQLQKLHESAIRLKEKFDKKQSPEAIEAWTELYLKELEALKKIIPVEVIRKGDLLRHSAFLKLYTKKQQPENAASDIDEICITDIFLTQSYFIHYISETDNPKEKVYDWHSVHPIIFKIAKPRFENLQFADAVEASFKEINDIIKQRYKNAHKVELDGSGLMRKAFTSSPNNNFKPTFCLADNSNESGRNIQQGYMDIFAGSMQGIRNPKAHANLDVNPDEAWEMIILSSHLMRMWDKYN
jgi:uncharacterized protein (TIGR02391 family)